MKSRIFFAIFKILFFFIKKIFISRLPGRNKVIVISIHKIGDSVFTIPAVNHLYNLYRNNLIVVCYENSGSIYKKVFDELNIITLSADSFLYRRIALPRARKIIKKIKPKFIYDITGTIASLSLSAGIKTEGLYGICDSKYCAAYNKSVLKRSTPPLTGLYLDAVKKLTGTYEKFNLAFGVKQNSESGLILIHPFAGWKAKEWNLRKFISLAELISKENECKIISEQGSIDNDIKEYLLLLNINLMETRDIDDLINEIEKCSIFISNDSGPLYIAALLGKSTFTIYGPTNPEYSLPEGTQHHYINKRLSCSPGINQQYCFTNAGRDGCPSYECMNLLKVNEVYERIKQTICKQKIAV